MGVDREALAGDETAHVAREVRHCVADVLRRAGDADGRHRGAKKAIVAVAASMLGACYDLLRDGVPSRDLGADHFSRHDKRKTLGRLVRRLHALGYEVELEQVA